MDLLFQHLSKPASMHFDSLRQLSVEEQLLYGLESQLVKQYEPGSGFGSGSDSDSIQLSWL